MEKTGLPRHDLGAKLAKEAADKEARFVGEGTLVDRAADELLARHRHDKPIKPLERDSQ